MNCISKLSEHNDERFYTQVCSCGCCTSLLLELKDSPAFLSISCTVSSENNKYHGNYFVDKFYEIQYRIKTAIKVLFVGRVKMSTEICLTDEGLKDYLKVLKQQEKRWEQEEL